MTKNSKVLSLYSGSNCHLCSVAEQLLLTTLVNAEQEYQKVDVASNHQLYHLYGAKIPVLKRHDINTELPWPFDQQQLIEFLS